MSFEAVLCLTIFCVTLSSFNGSNAFDKSSLCPEGWYDAEQYGCYFFAREVVDTTWMGALETCEQVGGFLAEPKSEEEMQILTGLALAEEVVSGILTWWIGANDLGHEGLWEWISSFDVVDKYYWSSISPNMDPRNFDDCVMLAQENSIFKWYDTSCNSDSGAHPICQRSITPSSTTLSPSSTTQLPSSTTVSPCLPDWLQLNSACFKLFTVAKSWSDSELSCQEFGGHLASFHSQEENNVMPSFLETSTWIGGTDEVIEDVWVWNDGTPMDWDNWGDGQRFNDTLENCMVSYDDGKGWHWADWICTQTEYYVCKIMLV